MDTGNILHHCPSGKRGTVEVFTGKPELEDMPAVQFLGNEWALYSTYDDGCWIPIDFCPYCGLKLAGTEK